MLLKEIFVSKPSFNQENEIEQNFLLHSVVSKKNCLRENSYYCVNIWLSRLPYRIGTFGCPDMSIERNVVLHFTVVYFWTTIVLFTKPLFFIFFERGESVKIILYLLRISKLHKYPSKERYIAESSKYATKPLSLLFAEILTVVKENFKSTVQQYIPKALWIRCKYMYNKYTG